MYGNHEPVNGFANTTSLRQHEIHIEIASKLSEVISFHEPVSILVDTTSLNNHEIHIKFKPKMSEVVFFHEPVRIFIDATSLIMLMKHPQRKKVVSIFNDTVNANFNIDLNATHKKTYFLASPG